MELGDRELEGLVTAQVDVEAQQRRLGIVEATPFLGGDEGGEDMVLLGRSQRAQILDRHGQLGVAMHQLQEFRIGRQVEGGAQDGVVAYHVRDRRLEGGVLEARFEVPAVDVVVQRILVRQLHVVEHPGLHPGQRVGVLDALRQERSVVGGEEGERCEPRIRRVDLVGAGVDGFARWAGGWLRDSRC